MLDGELYETTLIGGVAWSAGAKGERRTFLRATLPISLLMLACSPGGNAAPAAADGGVASSVGNLSTSVFVEDSGTQTVTTDQGVETPTLTRETTSHGTTHVTTQTSDAVPTSSPSPASTSDGQAGSDGVASTDTGDGSQSGDSDVSLPPGVIAFEPTGGGFDESQVVELVANHGETIHYTLDGSVPTLDSPVYDGPLTLEETTIVRAVISNSGVLTYFAQTYVQLEQDALDFSSNLPIVVVERHRDTPIDRDSDELRPSSLLVFEPGSDGRSHLLGEATLSHRAGARVRGAYSRAFPQVGYSLETWTAGADDDEDVPLLGMPADSDWVLSAPSEMDRALMRNAFAMDLSRTIGRYAPRTQLVEVFLVDNEQRDALSTEDYLGVFTAMEKIKRGPDRVNIAKLRETDLTGLALTGGYMFRIDHDENDFSAGGFEFGWVYPDAEEMVIPVREPQVTYISGYLGEFFDCLTDAAFTNPTTLRHYSEYIDVPAWIDHHLINMMTKNVDGLRLSSYFYKDRNALLVAGPVWDFDRSLGTPHDERVVNPAEWSSGDGTDHMTWGFWGQLFEDPDFSAAYWDRWDELRQSAFTEQSLVGMVDGYEARLTESRERHFERWTELPPQGSPAEEVDIIRDWLGERLSWIDAQRP